MISIKDLTLSYAGKRALSNINIEIRDGEFVVITGPNGGGKSTLLYTISGAIPHIIHADVSGSVSVNGVNARERQVSELSKSVGLLLQDPDAQLFTSDVESEIAFPLENAGKKREEIRKRLGELLPLTGLPGDKETWELSEGQKQRLAIAAVLALDPGTLLLDEPTAELDQKGKEDTYKMLGGLNMAGKTIVVVEHNSSLVARFSNRVIVLNEEVLYDGPLAVFRDQERCMAFGIEPLCPEGQIKRTVGAQARKKRPADAAVSVRGLTAKYEETTVFEDMSLRIGEGEFLVITGPTGSGKTTLIKHLNGLINAEAGSITLLGREIEKLTREEISGSTSFLSQNPEYQIFERTVAREVSFTLRRQNAYSEARLDEIANTFNIKNILGSNPHTLSHGQKQLVALASSLAADPRVVILDEPTAYLDYRTKLNLLKRLSELKRAGKTIVVVTHDVGSFAPLADRVLSLSGGKLK